MYDTSQAFLYGDVDEELYARAPDRWPELGPEGHCLRLRKSIYSHNSLMLQHEHLSDAQPALLYNGQSNIVHRSSFCLRRLTRHAA